MKKQAKMRPEQNRNFMRCVLSIREMRPEGDRMRPEREMRSEHLRDAF